jgi:hypothetical protein
MRINVRPPRSGGGTGVLRGLPLRARMHPGVADDQHHQDDGGDRRCRSVRMPFLPIVNLLGRGKFR